MSTFSQAKLDELAVINGRLLALTRELYRLTDLPEDSEEEWLASRLDSVEVGPKWEDFNRLVNALHRIEDALTGDRNDDAIAIVEKALGRSEGSGGEKTPPTSVGSRIDQLRDCLPLVAHFPPRECLPDHSFVCGAYMDRGTSVFLKQKNYPGSTALYWDWIRNWEDGITPEIMAGMAAISLEIRARLLSGELPWQLPEYIAKGIVKEREEHGVCHQCLRIHRICSCANLEPASVDVTLEPAYGPECFGGCDYDLDQPLPNVGGER